ncbi:MAG TPA: type VI secretion system tip protein TssI/VgrG [Gammaproteobacteria bacterium]|nr:type VI secretion system tip protein TssI/VgrG [Gammaproteobacteria bacterium]
MATPTFAFESGGSASGLFKVVDFQGTEKLNSVYRFEIRLKVEPGQHIDLADLLKQPATLILEHDKIKHYFHGMLAAAVREQLAGGYQFFRVTLVPPVWRLSLEYRSAVFVDKTVPAILEETFKAAGLSKGVDYDLSGLTGKYPTREFTCQYRETDLDFVSRLMEYEGIQFYFQNDDKTCKLMLADGRDYTPVTGLQSVMFADPGNTKDYESIVKLSCRYEQTPIDVKVKDYNYLQPSLNVLGDSKINAGAGVSGEFGSVWLFGENVTSPEEAKRLAALRAEEIGCWANVFEGMGAVCDLRAGYTFRLQGHGLKDYNQGYLVTEVHHGARNLDQSWGSRSYDEAERTGNDAYYSNRFSAVASSVQFRPRRVTPRPKVTGVLTGHIYSETAGNLLPIDHLGRYRVELPFVNADDPSKKVTCWMRMAQPAAGAKYGTYYTLESGAEVLVTFINGDPDRPVIWGSLYNGASALLKTSEGNFL